MNFVPSFARWLNTYDQSRGHEVLKTILKYLQWQDASRLAAKWILKSPSHLPYAEPAAAAFPKALLIMAHRDPVQTVQSYVSMQAALNKLATTLSDEPVGAFWFPRLTEWMNMFAAARERIGEKRFIDIDYREVGRDPLGQAQRVLAQMGIPVDEKLDAVRAEFMAGNQREQRPLHDYSLERFGLDEEAIKQAFADYRKPYIG
jgi:hypothetical protein